MIIILMVFIVFSDNTVASQLSQQFSLHAMVVSDQALASEVGLEILRKGGNAVDAAVAVGYALAVVQPCCGNIGGGGFMLIHLSGNETMISNSNNNSNNNGNKNNINNVHSIQRRIQPKDIIINFREKAPMAATENMFLDPEGHSIPDKSKIGFLAVAVPGTVLGFETALKKYGTLSRAEVMAPAIQLAEQGFYLTPESIRLFEPHLDQFKNSENIAKIFLKQNGVKNKNKKQEQDQIQKQEQERKQKQNYKQGTKAENYIPYKTGDKLVQKNLANTLKLISEKGAKIFYEGSIAEAIVEASKSHGGILGMEDFARYDVDELSPLQCYYHGYKILTTPPPSGGGVALCEMLNILEDFPLAALGHSSLYGKLYILEAMKYGFFDRNLLGDPDYVKNPLNRILSKEYIETLRLAIKNRVQQTVQQNELDKATNSSVNNSVKLDHSTTHYSIVDEFGNIVSVTYTLNGHFGAKVIAGDLGFFLNNEMDDFTSTVGVENQFSLLQGEANKIEPGKRPLSSMSPAIVFRDKRPFLVLGAAGGPHIITSNLLTLLNVIDYRMSLQNAVNAPRFHRQGLLDVVEAEWGAFSPRVSNELRRMGYRIELKPKIFSDEEAILFQPANHRIYGASDPRRPNGAVVGY